LAGAGFRVGWITAGGLDTAPGIGPDAPAPGAAARAADDWDSRIYAVSPGNIEWLTTLGAWAGVAQARVCDVTTMQVSGDDGDARIGFDTRTARKPRLAAICESRNLATGIERALQTCADRVTRIAGRVAELRIGERTASVTLDTGATVRAPLVVAGDGADSSIREFASITVTSHAYEHTAVVANLRCAAPHYGVARQWFFGDSVLALLPMPQDRRSMVRSCADAHARFLLDLSAPALCDEVARVTGGETGAVEPVTGAQGFPLKVQQVDRLVAPRVALVGDAAHTVHPLAGQGMNLGLGDCRELARVLAGRGPQPDLGDIALLQRYQRARAEPIAAMRVATDGLFRLFASDFPGVARMRNLGLGWVDGSTLLKRRLILAAMA
ncbi:MAG: FAD-dependent monooxygenase, partial [Proteobacteria bacterium]|nr:FAD-dependent monooxygenase [Burkholderiales bacterium]